MQVGVDEAVQEDHAADGAHAGVDDARDVDAARFEVLLVHAVDELHREHGVGARLGDEAREAHVGIAREVRGEARGCCRPRSRGGSAPRPRCRTSRAPRRATPGGATARRARRARPTNSRIARSSRTLSRMSGRRTLTATVSPVARSTARCTCATDAAATGSGSKLANSASSGRPSSRLDGAAHVVEARTAAPDRGAARARRRAARQEVGARRRDLPDLDERRAEPRADVDERRAERAGDAIAERR